MTSPFKTTIASVLDLTKEGKLMDAVARIQASITGKPPPSETAPSTASEIIDLVAPAKPGDPWTAPLSPGEKPMDETVRPEPPKADWNGSGSSRSAGLAAFSTHSFTNAAGTRRYKLFVPGSYAGAASPLIIMLHGCSQSPDDFATGTRMNALAEQFGLLVAYPEQSQAANTSKCWNWFNASDQQRDLGEPSIIAGLTRQIMTDFSVNPRRVFAAGLSAGGAAAAILGQTYPDLFAAVGIHSGLACGAAKDMMSAFGVMKNGATAHAVKPTVQSKVRAIVFHGDKDQTVHPLNGTQAGAQFMGVETVKSVSTGTSSGGAFTRTDYKTASGRHMLEQWLVHGMGHAWSGGSAAGSYTSAKGPDASREMVRFFLETPDTA